MELMSAGIAVDCDGSNCCSDDYDDVEDCYCYFCYSDNY